MRDRPLFQMLAIGAVASIIGLVPLLLFDWFPSDASEEADQIDFLYDLLLIASWPIFVLVMTIAIYSVVRFRARPGDTRDGPPLHGNALLEIVWVTIPFLIVTTLAIVAWVTLVDIEERKPDTMVVDVRAEQFTWSFAYPQEDGEPVLSNELVLPVDRPVEFRITTQDVIHSFWVPDFRLKSDAVPGITTIVRLTPSQEGSYNVVCAELCGVGHSTMRQAVSVLPEEDFTAWLSERQEALAMDGGAGAAEDGAAPEVSPSGAAAQAEPEEEPGGGTTEEAPAEETDGSEQAPGDGGDGGSGPGGSGGGAGGRDEGDERGSGPGGGERG
jgi:cytochrome c oxidase subunit II